MSRKSGQEFFTDQNRLWIDLHTCATSHARELFDEKLEEAFRYGVRSIEFIFGTPDSYEGSIKEALTELLEEGHDYVEQYDILYASVIISLKDNPKAEPQDDEMVFSAIYPEYDRGNLRHYSYHYPLYPYKEDFSTDQIATSFGISVSLVRKIAGSGDLPNAYRHTEYDEMFKKNITIWRFYKSDCEKIAEIVNDLHDKYTDALKDLSPTHEEMQMVFSSIRSLVPQENITRHAKTLLTRVRKKIAENENLQADSPDSQE